MERGRNEQPDPENTSTDGPGNVSVDEPTSPALEPTEPGKEPSEDA